MNITMPNTETLHTKGNNAKVVTRALAIQTKNSAVRRSAEAKVRYLTEAKPKALSAIEQRRIKSELKRKEREIEALRKQVARDLEVVAP